MDFNSLPPELQEVVREQRPPSTIQEFRDWCDYWYHHLVEVINDLHAGWDDIYVSQDTWAIVMDLARHGVRFGLTGLVPPPIAYPDPDGPPDGSPGMYPEQAIDYFRRAIEWCDSNSRPRVCTGKTVAGRSLTRNEAESLVDDYCHLHPKATRAEVAKEVGCSAGLVSNTAAWKRHSRRKSGKQGQMRREHTPCESISEELDRLIAEQEQDFEPSPLDEDGESPRAYPRP